MRMSAKAEYACLAVLELAAHRNDPEPARLVDLAQPHGIPERFLVQILLPLKSAGFVHSVRGAGGGYRLAVDPSSLSVLDVVQCFDAIPPGDDPSRSSKGWRVLGAIWNEAQQRENDYLRTVLFSDLVEQLREPVDNMYFI